MPNESNENPRLLARNAPAAVRTGLAPGNPVSTRLESGVGNCFPGLECDLRNLERRFFPYLTVDFVADLSDGNNAQTIAVVAADIGNAVMDTNLSELARAQFRKLSNPDGSLRGAWVISRITGDFGPLGAQTVIFAELNDLSPVTGGGLARRPADVWTALRLLAPGKEVTIHLERRDAPDAPIDITAVRARYLDENGAFAAMFAPGELTQSMCSPWTHDFRDCGCHYWASNHPDIVKPALVPGQDPIQLTAEVNWLRSDRQQAAPATADRRRERSLEMDYYDINQRWTELDVVIEGREARGPYTPGRLDPVMIFTKAEVEPWLRYAAGVELSAIQEYLAAAFSVNTRAGDDDGGKMLREDAQAAADELLRIAIGEMRHLRIVNDLLRHWHEISETAGPFVPALRVAAEIPQGSGGMMRPVQFRRLTPAVLDEFIVVEHRAGLADGKTLTVDGLYTRLLATFAQSGFPDVMAHMVEVIIADGSDHYQTFRYMQEWLGRHANPESYLLRLTAPQTEPQKARYGEFQTAYAGILENLWRGYTLGSETGRMPISDARAAMIGIGLESLASALAQAEVQVAFDTLVDPRFAPIAKPT